MSQLEVDFEVDELDSTPHSYSRYDSSSPMGGNGGMGGSRGWGRGEDKWSRGDDLPSLTTGRAPPSRSSQPSNNISSMRHGDETTDSSNCCTLFVARLGGISHTFNTYVFAYILYVSSKIRSKF